MSIDPEETPAKRVQLLFVCSRNQWRSPTAEMMFRDSDSYVARSAGTSPSAKTKVTPGHIGWADHILVMEDKHKAQLRRKYAFELPGKNLSVLNIPDEFTFMDPNLIQLLTTKLNDLGIHTTSGLGPTNEATV
jgi:predicted protein tyrosine phosphatase